MKKRRKKKKDVAEGDIEKMDVESESEGKLDEAEFCTGVNVIETREGRKAPAED